MELPIAMGGPTGPKGGTHQNRGFNIPTPRYQFDTVTFTLDHIYILDVRFLFKL